MCECRKAVDERLAVSNAKIAMGLLLGLNQGTIDAAPPMIVLEKINTMKRGKNSKLPILIATCCPFCGERYQAEAK